MLVVDHGAAVTMAAHGAARHPQAALRLPPPRLPKMPQAE